MVLLLQSYISSYNPDNAFTRKLVSNGYTAQDIAALRPYIGTHEEEVLPNIQNGLTIDVQLLNAEKMLKQAHEKIDPEKDKDSYDRLQNLLVMIGSLSPDEKASYLYDAHISFPNVQARHETTGEISVIDVDPSFITASDMQALENALTDPVIQTKMQSLAQLKDLGATPAILTDFGQVLNDVNYLYGPGKLLVEINGKPQPLYYNFTSIQQYLTDVQDKFNAGSLKDNKPLGDFLGNLQKLSVSNPEEAEKIVNFMRGADSNRSVLPSQLVTNDGCRHLAGMLQEII